MTVLMVLGACLITFPGVSRSEDLGIAEAKQIVLTEIAKQQQPKLCLVGATEFEKSDGYCVPDSRSEPALVVADFDADGRSDIGGLVRQSRLVKKEYRRKTSWWAWWRESTETYFVATVIPTVLLKRGDGGWILKQLLEVETVLPVGIDMQALDVGILATAPAALNEPGPLRLAKATPARHVLCISYCGKSTVAYFWDSSREGFTSVWLSD